MLATVHSATLHGVEGYPVTVEVHVAIGLPSFTVVGLPDTSCRESRDRVRAAILSSGLTVAAEAHHRQPRAIRPAQGGQRARSGHRHGACSSHPTRCLPRPCAAWRSSASSVSTARSGRCPARCRWSTRCRATIAVVPVASAVEASSGRPPPGAAGGQPRRADRRRPRGRAVARPHTRPGTTDQSSAPPDLADVRGQPFARRALEVAAAGRPPPAAGRASRRGQDDARQAAPRPAARSRPRRSDAGHPYPLGRRAGPAARRARAAAAVSSSAPQRQPRVAGRRRERRAAPRRGEHGERGRPVPR